MRIDKKEMLDDLRESKEFCMTTIDACKKLLAKSVAKSDDIPVNVGIAILAGLAEIKRVVKDYYGTI